jgi:outer membrane protein assembly factor BamB
MKKLIISTIAAAVVCSSALGQELEPGDKIWSFKTGGWVTSPAIESDGTIYVGSQDNNLYAINPDGSQKWAFKTGNGVHGSPTIGSDGTIYVGSWDQYLYAIKPDGKRKWRFKTNGTVWSRPVIGSDGTVYAGSWDNSFYAVKPDGKRKWAYRTGGWVMSDPAIGSDGTIYVPLGTVTFTHSTRTVPVERNGHIKPVLIRYPPQ